MASSGGDEEARRRSSPESGISSSADLEALFPGGGSADLEALFPGPGGGCSSEGGPGDEEEEGDPELVRVRARVSGWLAQYEPLLLWVQRLLVWERPLHSVCVALTLNTLFWLLSSTSLRPLFLLSISLLGLVLLERWKHKLPLLTVHHPEPEADTIERETLGVQPRLLSVPELSHHLAESYLTCRLYIQETLQYKRQHHGKFCVMMCSGCFVLAVVGHYVPGIMISYIVVLSVLLWPLVVYHELIQRMYTGLEPIFMKLDYSMKGDTQHRKHKVKKEVEEGDEPRAETESESEEELSCFAPTVDVKTTALAMAITDSELSDEEASILESGGFSVSRATTPQLTDLSEDLDQQSVHSDPEEAFLRDLPEFPSVEDFPSVQHSLLHFPLRGPGPAQTDGAPGRESSEGAEAQSAASLLFQHLASPLHFVNTHFNGHGRPPGSPGQGSPGQGGPGAAVKEEEEQEERERVADAGSQGPRRSLEALSEEIVSTAISTVVQNTLFALLGSTEAGEDPSMEDFLPAESLPCALDSPPALDSSPPALDDSPPALDSPPATPKDQAFPDDTLAPTEEEDFELLDQSELEQLDEGLGLGLDGQVSVGGASPADTPTSPQHQSAS